jgi:hypothetical protein
MRLARADSGLRARATYPAGEDTGGADADARNHRARLSDSNPAPHTAIAGGLDPVRRAGLDRHRVCVGTLYSGHLHRIVFNNIVIALGQRQA